MPEASKCQKPLIRLEGVLKSVTERHWGYFQLIEKDLATIAESIELAEDNYNTYGPRLVQLILFTGSELDVALKDFAKVATAKHPSSHEAIDKPNMRNYIKMLEECAAEEFSSASAVFLHTGISLEPWSPLSDGESCELGWWKAYNEVKHRRNECYQKANLRTAIELVAALFIVDVYLSELTNEFNWRGTTLVDLNGHIRMSHNQNENQPNHS